METRARGPSKGSPLPQISFQLQTREAVGGYAQMHRSALSPHEPPALTAAFTLPVHGCFFSSPHLSIALTPEMHLQTHRGKERIWVVVTEVEEGSTQISDLKSALRSLEISTGDMLCSLSLLRHLPATWRYWPVCGPASRTPCTWKFLCCSAVREVLPFIPPNPLCNLGPFSLHE